MNSAMSGDEVLPLLGVDLFPQRLLLHFRDHESVDHLRHNFRGLRFRLPLRFQFVGDVVDFRRHLPKIMKLKSSHSGCVGPKFSK